jgi:hypothetical protein
MANEAARVLQGRAARSISFAVLLGFIAQLSFALDLSVVLALLLYSFAAYLFVASLAKEENARCDDSGLLFERLAGRFGRVKIEAALVGFLLLIALLFRLYRLDFSPYSLFLDEGLVGLNALEILEGKSAPIWGMTPLDRWQPDWVQTSNLYLHYVALNLNLFGSGYFGLKMISILPAVGSVVVVYFLFREFAGISVAFLTAFLVAVSQWHVTISRWGWDAVLMGFLQLIAYLFLIRGIRTGKKIHFAASGGLIGLSLYTYIASWISLSIAIAFLVARAWRNRAPLRSRLGELSTFLAACLIIFAPLGMHYFKHPRDLTVRVSEVSLVKAIDGARGYLPLWNTLKNHALMFNYKGDKNARHSFPGEPVLEFVTSVFFVLGLAYCIQFWNRRHHMFLLLWFALGMQGGLLAEPSAAPHAYRTMMVIPTACFFAASSLSLFCAAIARALGKLQFGNSAQVIVCVVLSSYIVAANYRTYFVRRPKSAEVWEEEGRDGGLPARISAQRTSPALMLVDPLFVWKVVVANTWFLSYQPGKLFEPVFVSGNFLLAEPRFVQYGDEREVTYFYPPVFTRMIRSLFPSAPNEVVRSPHGETLYGIVKLNLGDLRDRLRSADKQKLAGALANTASFYEAQLPLDAEVGPRRQLLMNEVKAARERIAELAAR